MMLLQPYFEALEGSMEALISWSKSFANESAESSPKKSSKQRKTSSAKEGKGFG